MLEPFQKFEAKLPSNATAIAPSEIRAPFCDFFFFSKFPSTGGSRGQGARGAREQRVTPVVSVFHRFGLGHGGRTHGSRDTAGHPPCLRSDTRVDSYARGCVGFPRIGRVVTDTSRFLSLRFPQNRGCTMPGYQQSIPPPPRITCNFSHAARSHATRPFLSYPSLASTRLQPTAS